MIICIEVTEKTMETLERLLEVGHYRDYAQAISVAIANQMVLHREVPTAGFLVIPNNNSRSSASAATDSQPTVQSSAKGSLGERKGISALFGLVSSDHPVGAAAPLPNDTFVPGQEVPVDRWIFGQHNKLLPAKASCRGLANLLIRSADVDNGILLTKAASEIAYESVVLGDYLWRLDRRYRLDRDEALSYAFPRSGSDTEDKARIRFANQFVASINKQGLLSGLLTDLKLINHDHGKNRTILLTEPGWHFAKLQNPILDGGSTSERPIKFSPEEIAFLLEHIHLRVPVEDFAYRAVLGAIAEKANTPEKLDTVLEKLLSRRQEKPFSRAFLANQRSGVVSRMADLGLVGRLREGIRVTYILTQPGAEYLAAGTG